MRMIILRLMVCFASVILGVSCTIVNFPVTSPTSTLEAIPIIHTPINLILTNLIGDLLISPDRAGERVEIVGYFHGWDLLDEMNASPPVTRSDWVIADNSGAIYVTGSIPKNLDPSSPEKIWPIIRLVGTIRMEGDQIYLEAQSIELLPNQ